jgi:hypothetical protein
VGPEQACVRCGTSGRDLEVTGLGPRCRRCSTLAEIAALEDGGEMADHLTAGELELTARRGRTQILQGALLFAAGVGVIVVECLLLPFSGMRLPAMLLVGGTGLGGHGVYLRRQALRGLARFPTAEVARKLPPPR